MSFFIGTVVKWDNLEGLVEDSYGNTYKFEYGEVHPMDVLNLDIGSKVIVPEQGYIGLTSSSFSRWVEEEY